MLGAIAKKILFGGMTVKVEEELYFLALFFELRDQTDQTVDFWVKKAANLIKSSVEIPSTEASPIIADHNPIRIHHGHDVETTN